MKYRLIAAALAAFFMLPVFGLTAYATQIDDELGDIPQVELVEDAPETDEIPGIDTLETDTDETLPDYDAETSEAAELPALPPGTGTIIDYNTDPDGRLFYTIMTPDEHVFYLVIDKSSNTDNVYFLNAVTIADLAALAEIPATTPGGSVTTPPPATETPEQPTETPPPVEQPQSGGNMGMYIFIIVIAVAGGGAGWYFKIYRPKQQGAASGEEYDPSMDEAETDYADGWGEDSDDTDDSPQWDEDAPAQDGESEDEE